MCQTEVPDVLYRYHKSSDWKYLFEERTIRFTPLAEFNDPFEGKPAISSNYKKKSSKPSNGFYDGLTKSHGALCLTQNKNNILMWSHYAEAHKGFIVEFDIADLYSKIDGNILYDLSPIRYQEERPCIEKDDLIEQKNHSFLTKCVLTKGTFWKYEQEWRGLISFLGRHAQKINPIQPVGPSSIRSVIFGMSMPESDIQKRCRTLRGMDEYAHVKFQKAMMHDDKYEIIIEDITDSFWCLNY